MTFEIPENLDISYAAAFKKHILTVFSDQGESKLDLSKVERSGLSCVQLLYAAKKHSEANEVDFECNFSDQVWSILDDLGLKKYFI